MRRLDWVFAGLAVLATSTVIFMVGLVASASGMLPWLEHAPGLPSPSPAEQQTLPRNDTPGRDMPGIERYPQSVRVKYERYDLGETGVVEVGYLADSGIDEVSAFYEELSRDGGWSTTGSHLGPDDEVGILTIRGEGEDERRVFIEIEPRGKLVSVELEETFAGSP